MSVEIERIGDTKDRLGEAVVWDAPTQQLYWADASAGIIRRLTPSTGQIESWQGPAPLGALCITQSDRILLMLTDGAYYFDTETGATECYALVDSMDSSTRLNDSKIDREGRMVLGGLYLNYKTDQNYRAQFYTFTSDRMFRPFEKGVGITNGPCFSPDGRTLYIADTARRIIWAYDYSADGQPSNKRLFADDTILDGMPDGGTVDAEGHIWFTIMSRSALLRLAPDGSVSRTIEMPVNPTSVAFGGADLSTLYVTSLSQSVNLEVTAADAGGIFAITGLGIKGLTDVRFAD